MSRRNTAAEVYCTINQNQDRYGREASFIANVILSCSKPATRAKCLLARLRNGDEVSCLSFSMPYNGFFLNGQAVKFDILLAKPDADPEAYRLVS